MTAPTGNRGGPRQHLRGTLRPPFPPLRDSPETLFFKLLGG
jgi:hypothetical protein